MNLKEIEIKNIQISVRDKKSKEVGYIDLKTLLKGLIKGFGIK